MERTCELRLDKVDFIRRLTESSFSHRSNANLNGALQNGYLCLTTASRERLSNHCSDFSRPGWTVLTLEGQLKSSNEKLDSGSSVAI